MKKHEFYLERREKPEEARISIGRAKKPENLKTSIPTALFSIIPPDNPPHGCSLLQFLERNVHFIRNFCDFQFPGVASLIFSRLFDV